MNHSGSPAALHRETFILDIGVSCASVEPRDEPELKGKPVMVGSPPNPRGGVDFPREFVVEIHRPAVYRSAGLQKQS